VEGLIERHFKQSIVDVDDAIICGPSCKVIDKIIASLKEDYDVTDEGEIDDYPGVNVSRPTVNSRTASHASARARRAPLRAH
jgi:hypothetical protein